MIEIITMTPEDCRAIIHAVRTVEPLTEADEQAQEAAEIIRWTSPDVSEPFVDDWAWEGYDYAELAARHADWLDEKQTQEDARF